ncbi:DNA cytosine methyltransferase [Merismopedia glauca]|uniref:DNA (cytosine-5-)-methyltransferase n=1 Tax=Merismopedia glauca CCAP 1448/3 TaxID=1296344 RepID=A0A2T1C9M2_9CYAN|nr:DNA cytosine methyltransferase [Merismopedia glauca]PSB04939.1 DNA cytosine methyltransferase [Merismopedia glauca CCAP 1448/3]
MLRHLDLFSGIGGFTLAATRVGGICTQQFVEINPDAQAILRSHYPNIPIHPDIRSYTPRAGEFDLITCGFPCTGTSIAGTRQGLEHPESALWREGIRCLIQCQPKFCLIEQPEGIIRRGLRTILGALRMARYNFEIEIVSAAMLGACHKRNRLFIISYPNSLQWSNQPTCWANQMREMVERQRLDSQWLAVRQFCSSFHTRLSVRLVRGLEETEIEPEQYSEPTNSKGRIRARYLAGRTVTPPQAAIALRRILYLNSLIP